MFCRALISLFFLIGTSAQAADYDWQVYAASQSTLATVKKYVAEHRLARVDWPGDNSIPKECAKLAAAMQSQNYEFVSPTLWGENWDAESLVRFKPFMLSGEIGTAGIYEEETVYIARENIAVWIGDFDEDGKEDLLLYGQKWLNDEGDMTRRTTGVYELYEYKTLKSLYYVPIDDPYNFYKKTYSKNYSGVFKMNAHLYIVELTDGTDGVEPYPYLFFYRYTKEKINQGKTYSTGTCRLQLTPKMS